MPSPPPEIPEPRVRLAEGMNPSKEMQPWIDALRSVDEDNEKKPLVNLLKSDAPMPDNARWYLSDLLERFNLKKRPGGRSGRTTPAYLWTPAYRKLIHAAKWVNYYKQCGMSADDAIKKSATRWGLKSNTLRNHIEGRNTSARRMFKRQPPDIRKKIRP